MSSNEPLDVLEAIQPYLNPEYWDGHMVGDGGSEQIDLLPLNGAVHAARLLRERLNQSSKPPTFPLESFRSGDVFNPNAYQPGATVLFREEVLLWRPGRPMVQLYEASKQLVERRFDTKPFTSSEQSSLMLRVAGTTYSNFAWWGIVAATGQDGNRLHGSPVEAAIKFPSGRIRLLLPGIPPTISPIEIGHTRHGVYASGREELRRVNVLHVTGYGQRGKKRKVFDFLQNTALAHNH